MEYQTNPRTRQQFLSLAAAEFCTENVLFVHDVMRYKLTYANTIEEERTIAALEIYINYIRENARLEVNIPHLMRVSITESMFRTASNTQIGKVLKCVDGLNEKTKEKGTKYISI